MSEERRLRLTGLHHVTLVCADLQRSAAFYRDVLGLRLVEEGRSEDDAGARHFFFGDWEGSAGTLVTCLEYPGMEEGKVGRGSTHHFAFSVDSEEELQAWRGYLESRGVPTTEVLDRRWFKSLYLRDPDGHIVEIATKGPGFGPPPSAARTPA
jgi:glyoxylase I family protein